MKTDRRGDPRTGFSHQDHYGRSGRSSWPHEHYEGMDFRRPRNHEHDYPGEAYRDEAMAFKNIRDGGYEYTDREHEDFIPDDDQDLRPIPRRRRTGEARQRRRMRSDFHGGYSAPSLGYGSSFMDSGNGDPGLYEYRKGFGADLSRPGTEHYERGSGPRFGEYQSRTTSEFEDEVPNYRGKGPTSYKRSDERISEDLHECLTEHEGVDATNIEIKVEDGRVTLSGNVPNKWMKYQAEDMADRVKGVASVDNQIEIQKTDVNLRPSERR